MRVPGLLRAGLPAVCLCFGIYGCQSVQEDEEANAAEMKAFEDGGGAAAADAGGGAASADQQSAASDAAQAEPAADGSADGGAQKGSTADPLANGDEAKSMAPATTELDGSGAGKADAAPQAAADGAPADTGAGADAAMAAAAAVGAVGGNANAAGDPFATFPQDGAAPAEATDAPAGQPNDDDAAKRLALGQLSDDDLRQVIYNGLKARLTANGGTASPDGTEIGDYDSFKFTIVKLSRGQDDVSGGTDASEVPDGMDVEVTGWYKRQVAADGGDSKSACTSFDALVSLEKHGQEWRFRDNAGPAFGREDSEDCF